MAAIRRPTSQVQFELILIRMDISSRQYGGRGERRARGRTGERASERATGYNQLSVNSCRTVEARVQRRGSVFRCVVLQGGTRARTLARSEQRAPLSAAATNGGIAPLLPRHINGFPLLPHTANISPHSLSLALLHPSPPSPLTPFVLSRYSQVMSSLSSTRLAGLLSPRACILYSYTHTYM